MIIGISFAHDEDCRELPRLMGMGTCSWMLGGKQRIKEQGDYFLAETACIHDLSELGFSFLLLKVIFLFH